MLLGIRILSWEEHMATQSLGALFRKEKQLNRSSPANTTCSFIGSAFNLTFTPEELLNDEIEANVVGLGHHGCTLSWSIG